jgi:hypothetical protein
MTRLRKILHVLFPFLESPCGLSGKFIGYGPLGFALVKMDHSGKVYSLSAQDTVLLESTAAEIDSQVVVTDSYNPCFRFSLYSCQTRPPCAAK